MRTLDGDSDWIFVAADYIVSFYETLWRGIIGILKYTGWRRHVKLLRHSVWMSSVALSPGDGMFDTIEVLVMLVSHITLSDRRAVEGAYLIKVPRAYTSAA
jgi:hypothetical protein